MRKTLILFTVAALAGLCALAATAYAKPLPDSSAVDQYTEAVPAAGGQQASKGGGGTLPGGTAEALASQGKDGAGAAAAAKLTAPEPGHPGGSETSGMGIVLPLVLIAALLAAVAAFVARRRQRGVSTG
jgi:hypothetical protein